MGRPEDFEITATWRIHGDDKDVQYEMEWIEEQLAIHNVLPLAVTGQRIRAHRVVWSADAALSNSEEWCNDGPLWDRPL